MTQNSIGNGIIVREGLPFHLKPVSVHIIIKAIDVCKLMQRDLLSHNSYN